MPRPKKYRKVGFLPEVNHFGPLGVGKCNIESLNLKVEELEAIRLKDIEGLSQEECGKKMEVSRQTFQNILESARKKIALALTEGKGIIIEGGHYRHSKCKYRCTLCGNSYHIDFEKDKTNCPECGSEKVKCKKNLEVCRKFCKKSLDK